MCERPQAIWKQGDQRIVLNGLGSSILLSLAAEAHSAPAPFCGAVDQVPSWAFTMPWEEEVVSWDGYSTWTRVVGKKQSRGLFGLFAKDTANKKLPLLCIHGGPGFPSRYLETLELLAGQERRVAFYDQVGCGNSLKASSGGGPALADVSVGLFVAELAAVRDALGLERCHVLGHGWGGQLALQAACSGKLDGVASLTLSSTAPSQARLLSDRRARLEELPDQAREQLLQGGVGYAGVLNSEYGRRFITRRLNVGCINVAEGGTSSVTWDALMGGRYFEAGGGLVGWSVEEELRSIRIPTLVLRGDEDEVLEGTGQAMAAAIPSAMLVSLQGAGSFAHIDACESFLNVVQDFLIKHDA
eukprot:jgi/Botrbrau1/13630/Bobra.0373s0008.3